MNVTTGLAVIVGLGVLAQWLAWRLRFPSIVLLLFFGFLAGPVYGLIDVDTMFGPLLFPLISISVAVILFEGGLSLSFSELPRVGNVIRNLVTLGAVVTWLLVTVLARFLLDFDLRTALLLGAILVVTGPTVIGPMLQQMRPTGHVGTVLKWEGIMIDPVGATLAVLVFEAVFASAGMGEALGATVRGIGATLVIGAVAGLLGAGLVVLFLKRFWLPDFLQNPVSLMMVVVVLAASNRVQADAGLLSVTVMGMVLANQKTVSVKHIVEFKESLRVLLISSLFIILAARVSVDDFRFIDRNALIFLALLVFVVRPLAVYLSTIKSNLNVKEKLLLSWMAPRGIVAAAVASVFSFELMRHGHPEAERLVPMTFMVIIGTVTTYGLTAPYLARLLKMSSPNPQGVLIVGAHAWARSVACVLAECGFRVLLIDSNFANVASSRVAHLRCIEGDALDRAVMTEMDLEGIGRLLALTPNDEINSLAAIRYRETFGRSEVYQLSPGHANMPEEKKKSAEHLGGRFLFSDEATYGHISRMISDGATVEQIPLTGDFDLDVYKSHYGERALPLFLVTPARELVIFTADKNITPKAAQTLISLIKPKD